MPQDTFSHRCISYKVVTWNKPRKPTTRVSNWVARLDTLNSADAWFPTLQAASHKQRREQWSTHIPLAHIDGHVTSQEERTDHCCVTEKNPSWCHWVTDTDQSLLFSLTSKHNCSTSSLVRFYSTGQTLCYLTWWANSRLQTSALHVPQHMGTSGLHVFLEGLMSL